ncbi:hypothetical protein C472_03798 [Halorubrum tebenquichense DSM 14210]|uniref:Uncharacterized protein n=1 Tax=Halorubrum tebenquichense DSM 14210 TaxID=1227485 RepID=M0DZ83_9EURY|nr:hypothetical protein C472_03798 [Halorubrum tebenquichense DSM 14210]
MDRVIVIVGPREIREQRCRLRVVFDFDLMEVDRPVLFTHNIRSRLAVQILSLCWIRIREIDCDDVLINSENFVAMPEQKLDPFNDQLFMLV